jgi:putative hydrolase of the HAD superfamily
VSWVMFDFGGVLCTPQPQEDLAALAAVAGVSIAELWNAYWPLRPAYDAADLTLVTYWQGVAGRLGRSFSEAQIGELSRLDVASWAHLREDAVQLVLDLEAAGQRLALLSNAPADMARAVAGLPLARHFEQLLFSCYLRAIKPDRGCFSQALARLGARADEVIFIDDRQENVTAAGKMGINAIRFTGSQEARADLAGMFGVYGLLP